ncbi:hypothetical protein [Fluviicola taffensis]|uniref:Uncharacterized protein n=1 Tax=Fluviicola taffensis (strain DSM 16823 / NCIMB 13979 / RW262) TaxID=755732 RepID=F2I9U4_FLUTR|nr:hypothetical protein [Fluviicola taffensis]AEA43090.1 hypothetical protein Fluta_1093 [Fluviicola taffensis DSM 16823]
MKDTIYTNHSDTVINLNQSRDLKPIVIHNKYENKLLADESNFSIAGFWISVAVAVVSLGALLISYLAMRATNRSNRQQIEQANKNNRQQILVGKIEEIYECVTTLNYYYRTFQFIYNQLNESHDSEKHTANERSDWGKEYTNSVEQFVKRNNVEDLHKITARLRVLSNTYLSGELQLKCLTYNDMFEKMMDAVIYGQKFLQGAFYKEGFPEALVLQQYLEAIQNDLVKINELGSESLSQEKIGEYRRTTFKKDLGLIK